MTVNDDFSGKGPWGSYNMKGHKEPQCECAWNGAVHSPLDNCPSLPPVFLTPELYSEQHARHLCLVSSGLLRWNSNCYLHTPPGTQCSQLHFLL